MQFTNTSLINLFRNCSTITDVSIRSISAELSLGLILTYLPNLTCLDLIGYELCNFTGFNFQQPLKLKQFHCNGQIKIDPVNFQSLCCGFRSLIKLYVCDLNWIFTCSILLSLAQYCQTLTKFSVSGNAFTCSSENVVKLFQSCKHITELNIGRNCYAITDETIEKCAPYMINLTALTLCRDLTFTDRLLNALQRHCRKLTQLNVFECPHIGFAAIKDLIHVNSSTYR